MKRAYKILRAMAVSLIALLFLLPAMLYVALSLPVVQRYICDQTETALTDLLQMDVEIEHVSISPFNRVAIHHVNVADSLGRRALTVERLGAGINYWELLFNDRIVVDYAELIGLDARLTRDTVGGPLNIQPAIDALSPKDKTKPPTQFDFRINTVVIRRSAVTYDILSEPRKTSGFDPQHIAVKDLRADVLLPCIKNDDFTVDLRRLAFNEQCGLIVENISGNFHVTNRMMDVRGLTISLPGSRIGLNDQTLRFNGYNHIADALKTDKFDLSLAEGSHLSTSDFVCFLPQLDGMNMDLAIDLHAHGCLTDFAIERLNLSSSLGAQLQTMGHVYGLTTAEGPHFELPEIDMSLNGPRALGAVLRFRTLNPIVGRLLENVGDLRLNGSFDGSRRGGSADIDLSASGSHLIADLTYSKPDGAKRPMAIDGRLTVDSFDGSRVFAGIATPVAKLTSLQSTIDFNIALTNGIPDGTADFDVASATYNGQTITDLTANVMKKANDYQGRIFVDNPMLYADADIRATLAKNLKELDFTAELHDLDLSVVGLDHSKFHRRLSVSATGSLHGSSIDDVAGNLTIDRLYLAQTGRDDFHLNDIEIKSLRHPQADTIIVKSPIIDGAMTGHYRLSTMARVAKAIVGQTMPMLADASQFESDNHFWATVAAGETMAVDMRLKTLEPLAPLVKIPVGLLQEVAITGSVDGDNRSMQLNIDAPFLSQGNKLIENTTLMAGVSGWTPEGNPSRGHLSMTTTIPTKKGQMTIVTTAQSADDCVDSQIEWKIEREHDFSGRLSFSTCFRREEDRHLATTIRVNPSKAVFNDTVWTIDPATIAVNGNNIEVDGFKCWRDEQYIAMSGHVSDSPADTLMLTLRDVNLDYIFETLDIQTAMFGGNASGNIYATQLLTQSPKLYTPGLDVRRLTYNHSLMGDALIRSEWVNRTKAVSLIAEISQPNGRKSFVDGNIYPMGDSLDIYFDADRIEIGFLKPYMSAFASDISGYASGNARLFGTFKLIDMVGDVYGEDVKLTLGFTNTTYQTTDSVHFKPGRIDLDNLLLKDKFGHTATLNGWVTHECFKSPRFDFRITDARDLLVYDMPENDQFQWFGTVYGNGGARVTGRPGLVDINVDMTTAPGSTFTYILSDALSAQDYNFVTFRDRDQAKKDSIAALNAPPAFVREFKERMAHADQGGSPSKYKMTFNIGITPQVLMTLVMDPVGGDKIRAHGSGTLNMSYDSANEDLRMNGTYTLDDGRYNFTLQDIIIKEFIIEPGSSIAFNGDPYAAQLNITAKHHVKANLTDLDESFQEDKELNRTAVPVDALMMVRGDMRQPEIAFDLDFPTITEESKRKIRSIINTEEMMNRQIIYLLALSRFYTPDYMNATRGNELVSVASSTISSQLSNILGQLSDNWNIAPNVRSDRGDFSDVEFDLALSSRLLDNRLLFNGNFGYRDKSLNNNSFIGDFDIEYLLNRSGSLRLKAYNRYNDQNYYLKSALTTQGVGIVFKRDFDNMFSFLKPWFRHKKSASANQPADSTAVVAPSVGSAVEASPAQNVSPAVEKSPSTVTHSDDFIIFK